MNYEVVENAGEWIVTREGCEVGRFDNQDRALHHVAERLRGADRTCAASLAVRYQARTG
jgi:hypothetical protein